MEWPFCTAEVLEMMGYQINSRMDKVDIPCPYCGDKKRHLNFNLKKNQFRCNRCGAFGNTLQFYQFMMGFSNCREAYWSIMEQLGLKEENQLEIKKRSIQIQEENSKITTAPLLDIRKRHETYQAVLDHLVLEPRHVEELKKRGLSEMEILNLGYKSFPGNLDGIMNHLYDDGVTFIGVPGFYEYFGKIKFIKEKCGILIPVRNFNGYIEGLQLRIDDSEREIESDGKLSKKYCWLSSSKLLKGCGISAIHYACQFKWDKRKEQFYPDVPNGVFYLTEGPMKGDIAHFLTEYGIPIMAVPGVNHYTKLENELMKVKNIGVRKIVLLFDMDYKHNENVYKALCKTKEIIRKLGLDCAQMIWDESYKGIDDYLLFRKKS